MQLDPVLELVQQPRLADAGVADHRHAPCLGCGHDPVELAPQHVELWPPADHPRLDTFDAARRHPEAPLLDAADEVHADGVRLALHEHRFERLDVEDAPDVAVRVVGDEHAAVRCQALDPAGDVHRVADRRELTAPGDHPEVGRPGVDPDAHGQLVRITTPSDHLLHEEPGAHGPLRIVLPRRRHAPHRHHGVADVLVDVPTEVGDHGVEAQPTAR